MGKRKLKTVFWVFLLLIVTGLIGCKQKEPEKEQLCHIVMEKGDGYQVTDPVRTIKSGSNVSFTVTLDNNWQILGTDYHGETEIIKDDVSGYIVNNRNKEEMKEKALELLDDKQKLALFGHEARLNAEDYSYDSVKEKWLSMINDILS